MQIGTLLLTGWLLSWSKSPGKTHLKLFVFYLNIDSKLFFFIFVALLSSISSLLVAHRSRRRRLSIRERSILVNYSNGARTHGSHKKPQLMMIILCIPFDGGGGGGSGEFVVEHKRNSWSSRCLAVFLFNVSDAGLVLLEAGSGFSSTFSSSSQANIFVLSPSHTE